MTLDTVDLVNVTGGAGAPAPVYRDDGTQLTTNQAAQVEGCGQTLDEGSKPDSLYGSANRKHPSLNHRLHRPGGR